jgi:8-oxo-dGTP pyrophosphatase MutT (NUDIX family)
MRPRIILVNRSIVLNDKKEILLIKRSEVEKNNPNLWEVPGGKLDEGQDVANALEREVLEETGLLVYVRNRLAYFESFIIPEGRYKGMPYIAIVGISIAENQDCKLSEEHQDYKWCSYEECLEEDLADVTRKALISLKTAIQEINI